MAGQPVAWHGVASKAPSISYIEGALLYCAQAGTVLGDDTPERIDILVDFEGPGAATRRSIWTISGL